MRERFIIVRHPKNKQDRVVPMSKTLYRILDALPRYIESPFAFTNARTQTAYTRFNNTTWRRALKRAGIKNFRWNDLRHTFGSRLAQRGESILAISKLMGHKDIKVTMRYAHLSPSNLRSAVQALDRTPQESGMGTNTTHLATHKPLTEHEKAG